MQRSKSQIRLPGSSNRTTVIGRTGSGKSQFATWLLSTQNFDQMPWVIIDFKDEDSDIINNIQGRLLIDYDVIPEEPGVYMLKPKKREVHTELASWLEDVLQHGNIGLFFDEVAPMGQHCDAFDEILMQGRSKNVPVIVCTQRPSNISAYCFSEASFCMVFDLSRNGDRKRVSEEFAFIPRNYQLPEYHSYYYDVARKYDDRLGAAPPRKRILQLIADKMPPPPRRTI